MIRLICLSTILLNLLLACKSPAAKKNDLEPIGITWSKDVPAKHDIYNGAAVTYNDMIYVVSGKEGRLMKYNPANYSWLDLSGLPSPMTESGVALWNDRIVVAGGINDSSQFMRRVDYFDLKDQVWKEMTSLPNPRSRFTLSVQNGLLYASCGVCGLNDQSYGNCLDVLLYDEPSKTWKPQSKFKTGRYSNASATFGNALYCFGGYGLDSKVGSFYIDHTKKEFGFKRAIPADRGNFGAVQVGNYVLTFGGKVQGSNSPMEQYDIANDTWTSFEKCPFWNDRFASTLWHNRIYIFGGSQSPVSVWKGDIVFKKEAGTGQ